MKDTTTYKGITGLTQEEMAMALGITISQWSMYKSGQRDIPQDATIQLADLLTNITKAKSVSRESTTIAETEKKKVQEWLKREYLNLQYKEQLLERKISTMENIRSECFAALETAHYLESQPEKGLFPDLSKYIKVRATTTLNKNALQRLQELQLKKESVTVLKNSVEQKLKQNGNAL